MIKEIVHDPEFLAEKSVEATRADLYIAENLLDTLENHKNECVGMAANMIGEKKRIICFDDNGKYKVMLNPEIIKKSDSYETQEGCLSLSGKLRKTKRYKKIRVMYQTTEFKIKTKVYEGWTAQIIQHEIDHLNGVLI